MGKKQTFPLFGDGFAVVPPPVGKPKGRGSNTAGRVANRNFEISLQTVLELKNCGPARRCHTYGGRRIETPFGGPPPPPVLCGTSSWRESVGFWKGSQPGPRLPRSSRGRVSGASDVCILGRSDLNAPKCTLECPGASLQN